MSKCHVRGQSIFASISLTINMTNNKIKVFFLQLNCIFSHVPNFPRNNRVRVENSKFGTECIDCG